MQAGPAGGLVVRRHGSHGATVARRLARLIARVRKWTSHALALRWSLPVALG